MLIRKFWSGKLCSVLAPLTVFQLTWDRSQVGNSFDWTLAYDPFQYTSTTAICTLTDDNLNKSINSLLGSQAPVLMVLSFMYGLAWWGTGGLWTYLCGYHRTTSPSRMPCVYGFKAFPLLWVSPAFLSTLIAMILPWGTMIVCTKFINVSNIYNEDLRQCCKADLVFNISRLQTWMNHRMEWMTLCLETFECWWEE